MTLLSRSLHVLLYFIGCKFWLRIISKYHHPTLFSLSPDKKEHMVFYLNKLDTSIQKKAKSQVWFILVKRQGWTCENLMPLIAYREIRKILIRNAHWSPSFGTLYKSVHKYHSYLWPWTYWSLTLICRCLAPLLARCTNPW